MSLCRLLPRVGILPLLSGKREGARLAFACRCRRCGCGFWNPEMQFPGWHARNGHGPVFLALRYPVRKKAGETGHDMKAACLLPDPGRSRFPGQELALRASLMISKTIPVPENGPWGQRRLECLNWYCRELARTQRGGMFNARWFQKARFPITNPKCHKIVFDAVEGAWELRGPGPWTQYLFEIPAVRPDSKTIPLSSIHPT